MQRHAPTLPPQLKAPLEAFQNRLLELFPGEICRVILYGSYARGEARADSDVDVMVVVKWVDPERAGGHYLDNLADPRWERVMDAAVDAMLAYHSPFISPLVIGERLYNTPLPVAEEARREGITLWKNLPI